MTDAGLFAPRSALWRALAAGLVALLAGCSAMTGSQSQPAPAAAPAMAVSSPDASPPALEEPIAAPVVPAQPFSSRFSDFIARRLHRQNDAPAAVLAAEAPAVAETTVPPVDEKYRLTAENARELERGDASWYGSQFHGRRTASGEAYDKYALTAAHKTLPFGTIVRVRSLALGREVDVRINDRGPFSSGRVIDVSQAAAHALGLTGLGVTEVSLNVAAPLGKMAPVKRSVKKASRRPAGMRRH